MLVGYPCVRCGDGSGRDCGSSPVAALDPDLAAKLDGLGWRVAVGYGLTAFIRGTYESMPRGKFLQRLEQVTVTFGEPFDPRSFDETARPQEQVVEAVHERVAELGTLS
jgi:hypothetical protein